MKSRSKSMLRSLLKPVVLASALLAVSSVSIAAQLTASRAVFYGSDGVIQPELRFSTPESGDVYIAFRQNGQGDYYYIHGDGSVSTSPAAYDTVNNYTGTLNLPSFNSNILQPAQYQLFALLVVPGGDVNNFQNWLGGFSALKSFNFSVGYPGDDDGDGFRDDDLNRDGFPDHDNDGDGYHDDDHDRDGRVTPINTASATGTTAGTATTTTTQPSAAAVRGESVYLQSCSMCHGNPPAYSNISKGVSASSSRVAIAENKGGMGYLTTTDAELEDIASFLRGDTTTVTSTNTAPVTSTPVATVVPTPIVTPVATTSRGAELWATNCSSCHGNSISKFGDSASDTSRAIQRNKGGMGYLSFLTNTELQEIANFARTGSTGSTTTNTPVTITNTSESVTKGQATYNQYCASCHGANPSRDIEDILSARSASTTARAISRNKGGMGYLTNLTTTDLQNIADFVTNSTRPTTTVSNISTGASGSGQDLYNSACASCHGIPPSRDDIEDGRDPNETVKAIRENEGGMGYLSYLSYSEIQSIADYLRTVVIYDDDDDDDDWDDDDDDDDWDDDDD